MNIDIESEERIINELYKLAGNKKVILISHRLANVVKADQIYVMKAGEIEEQGTHIKMLQKHNIYSKLWHKQQQLEQFTGGGKFAYKRLSF